MLWKFGVLDCYVYMLRAMKISSLNKRQRKHKDTTQ